MSMCESGHAAVPPPTPEAHSTLCIQAKEIAADLRALSESGAAEQFSDEALRQLMSASIGIYASKAEGRGDLFPLAQSGKTNATAVLMAISALLKGSSLELFELGMWQSWSGMK